MSDEKDATDFIKELTGMLEPFGGAANVLFPVAVMSIVGVRTALAEKNEKLNEDERKTVKAAWNNTGLALIASWGLVNSQSLAAEAGCLAVLGISPWASEVVESLTTFVEESKDNFRKAADSSGIIKDDLFAQLLASGVFGIAGLAADFLGGND